MSTWLLSGCQTSSLPRSDWEAQLAWARNQPTFMLLGKLGAPSGSANLRWEQFNGRFVIRLWGPMGQATTLITGDVHKVVLERADGGARRVGDPALILSEELGWRIPVGALSYWVRGVPSPASTVQNLRVEDGRAAAFDQEGWHVEIPTYLSVADKALPGRVIAASGEQRVTLIVREWHLGNDDSPAR